MVGNPVPMCTFRQWPSQEWHLALPALLEVITLKSQPPGRLPSIPPDPVQGGCLVGDRVPLEGRWLRLRLRVSELLLPDGAVILCTMLFREAPRGPVTYLSAPGSWCRQSTVSNLR